MCSCGGQASAWRSPYTELRLRVRPRWQAVARHMPPDWTLAAPTCAVAVTAAICPARSAWTRTPGTRRRCFVISAVQRVRPVLAGHSMGAYVALLARDAHPELVRLLAPVDGGLPLPVPDGTDLDAVLDTTLGPAVIARLGQSFPSTEAYLDFWRAHPALAGALDPRRRGVRPLRPDRRSRSAAAAGGRGRGSRRRPRRASGETVRRRAGSGSTRPTPLLTAPAGPSAAPPPLIPHEAVQAWQGTRPGAAAAGHPGDESLDRTCLAGKARPPCPRPSGRRRSE